MATLTRLAEACGKIHPSYSDFVMLAALLAARSSEVSDLQAGDVRFDKNIVVIVRQTYPGKGGLITKQTKDRRERRVPILDPLRPILERLAEGKEPEDRLLVGPKGGALTTATVRDATNWDQIVSDLGLPDPTRHGLQHTGATWMADAGIPLHVLQDILGHASVETTRGYVHPDDRHLASAAEQANAFLARSAKASRPSRHEASRSLLRGAGSHDRGLWSPFGPLIHRRRLPESQVCPPAPVSRQRCRGEGTRVGPTKTRRHT